MKKIKMKLITCISAMAVFSLLVGCKKEQAVPAPGELGALNASASLARSTGDIPERLKVPEGNKLVGETFARGVQIYQVQRSAVNPNVFAWVNTAPLATLYKKQDFTQEVALHFAGPSWQFTKGHGKGEKVVARKLEGITEDQTAIQWLLLKAVDSLSSANNKITFVQRLSTAGGLEPSGPADEAHLGQMDSIPYTARYLFYEKQH